MPTFYSVGIAHPTPTVNLRKCRKFNLNVEAIRESPLHLGGILELCGSPEGIGFYRQNDDMNGYNQPEIGAKNPVVCPNY
jgi:hypothetical protein